MALILIVDDSPTEVYQMRRMLENHGFETEGATDGAEGIRKAREIRPDLILMDIVMPGVDGFRATRTLANDPATRKIPVIMVSSKSQETDLGHAPGRGRLPRQAGHAGATRGESASRAARRLTGCRPSRP
jgi:twitching motility two-component system response regulator PilH